MSKIKTNPSRIKKAIISIKQANLEEDIKATVLTILTQYQKDKADNIYTDGEIRECIFKLACDNKGNEDLSDKLFDIAYNLDKRKYF